jgi:hypothetical protein
MMALLLMERIPGSACDSSVLDRNDKHRQNVLVPGASLREVHWAQGQEEDYLHRANWKSLSDAPSDSKIFH